MQTILLPEKIIDEGISLLRKHAEVVLLDDPSEESILREVHDVFGVVLRSRARITNRILEKASNLKVISRTGAGYDNIDVQAATEHGVLVCNLPGINSVSVAEHTLALVFALIKRLPLMDQYVRTGNWQRRSQYMSRDIAGMELGIIGLGKIGREVMVRAQAFGMSVLAYDPYVTEHQEGVTYCDAIDELCSRADVITVHVPSLPQTRELISKELIDLMKPSALFVNTSRGALVDEQALITALKTGSIAGAALDVFSVEPIDNAHPFLELDNVILTPHTAALTKESGVRMTVEAVKQVIDCLEGRIPPYVVNRELLSN